MYPFAQLGFQRNLWDNVTNISSLNQFYLVSLKLPEVNHQRRFQAISVYIFITLLSYTDVLITMKCLYPSS